MQKKVLCFIKFYIDDFSLIVDSPILEASGVCEMIQ